MNYKFSPFLNYERELKQKIHDALEGDVIDQVMQSVGVVGQNDSIIRTSLAIGMLKVEPEIMPHLYQLLQDTVLKLKFDRQVEFYITNSVSVNACTLIDTAPDRPVIIRLNSALIELMTEDELRFVVGHELGHQINRDGDLSNLISFIFPELESMSPLLLQLKVRAWNQLCELVADRFGFLAAGNRNACISAFFKLQSGLNLNGMNIDIDAFVRHNHKLLAHFYDGQFLSLCYDDHPANAIRVEAINAFATASSQEELDAIMKKLVFMISRVTTSEIDSHMPYFMAAAGLIIASADGEVSEDEKESILQNISRFTLFPMNMLKKVENGDVVKIFNENLAAILQKNPGLRGELFGFIMDQVLSDNKLKAEEVNLMIKIGVETFGFSQHEVMNAFAQRIREEFRPSFSSIC